MLGIGMSEVSQLLADKVLLRVNAVIWEEHPEIADEESEAHSLTAQKTNPDQGQTPIHSPLQWYW
jgi:hypothetical protein